MNKPDRTVYIVGSGGGTYANWMEAERTNRIEDATFVVFTGGEDVTPHLYGERAHPTTFYSYDRDVYESRMFAKALVLGKPMVGICRGCQFLTVMSGGKLVQDQPNPQFIHQIETYDGETIYMSSTHHQAAYPWKMPKEDFKIIAWTSAMLPYHWGSEDGEELVLGVVDEDKEVESVFYPKTKCLGIQGHPEMIYDETDPKRMRTITWCRRLLDKHLAGQL